MKLWSQYFVPTLKESPADAEIASHKLLVRAGLVRKLSGGTALVLAGQPGDVNTVETPQKVAPKTVRLTAATPVFAHTFPPYSTSVLRLKIR